MRVATVCWGANTQRKDKVGSQTAIDPLDSAPVDPLDVSAAPLVEDQAREQNGEEKGACSPGKGGPTAFVSVQEIAAAAAVETERLLGEIDGAFVFSLRA